MHRQPNILVFCTDQHRADHLACAGNPVLHTPNLDRLAREGVRFENCYTPSPACMPARVTMFTGLTNRVSGVRTNGVSLPEDVPTVPGLLAGAGYRTHSVGKLHLKTWGGLGDGARPHLDTAAENPERLVHWADGAITQSPDDYYGFQTQDSAIGHVSYITGDYKVWLDTHHPGAYAKYQIAEPGSLEIDPDIHYNHWIADRAIDFLDTRRQPVNPFFLWCSFPDPHSPFAAVRPWADFYRDRNLALPRETLEIPVGGMSETLRVAGMGVRTGDAAYLRECLLQTYAMISHVDEQVGRVLTHLEATGLDRDTIVVFLSDHGEQLGEHGLMHKGCYPYDGHIRVPFLCKVPRNRTPGRVIEDVVSLLDLAPSLLDLAGVAQPEDPNLDRAFRKSCGILPAALPGESLKPVLLEGRAPCRCNALVEFDDESFKACDLLQMRMLVTRDYKLVYYSPTQELLLFDRHNDPGETRNLAADPSFAALCATLLKQLLTEICRTESRRPRRLDGA